MFFARLRSILEVFSRAPKTRCSRYFEPTPALPPTNAGAWPALDAAKPAEIRAQRPKMPFVSTDVIGNQQPLDAQWPGQPTSGPDRSRIIQYRPRQYRILGTTPLALYMIGQPLVPPLFMTPEAVPNFSSASRTENCGRAGFW